MGGQACVFYGAAEFSRDCDIVMSDEESNLQKLRSALNALDARCIAVPPFDPVYLARGHAVHFRCHHSEAKGMRLDVMTKMRGVDEFGSLWERRTTLQDADSVQFELLGIHDLIKAKKTQRDKDWPMIRRLVESHYAAHRADPNDDRIAFWLLESRTPAMLIEVAAEYDSAARSLTKKRPLLNEAFGASESALEKELRTEQFDAQGQDRNYWNPLKRELERLRRDADRKHG